MKPPPRVRFDGWPALFPVLDWGGDHACPLRRWWFAVEAPEPSPAATFLDKLALSGRYVRLSLGGKRKHQTAEHGSRVEANRELLTWAATRVAPSHAHGCPAR